jgi:plastocyanin
MRNVKMTNRSAAILITAAIFVTTAMMSASLQAANIDGTVVIKTKLTKRRITASVPLYERGPTVELGADSEDDPLAFERSRVAVYLEGDPQPGSATSIVVKMGQVNRRFSPDMLVVSAGSRVSFPNLDPVFHNVFSLSNPKTFDLGNYPKGDTRLVTFAKPGIVYVNCHLHANMTATIVVAPNRWNTIAARDGRFALADIPPGKYTIVAWHKAAGFFRQEIQVRAGGTEHVEFLIPIDPEGRKLEAPKPGSLGLSSKTR